MIPVNIDVCSHSDVTNSTKENYELIRNPGHSDHIGELCKQRFRLGINILIGLIVSFLLVFILVPLIYFSSAVFDGLLHGDQKEQGGIYFSNKIVHDIDGSVVLLGDSLVNSPCIHFDLISKMKKISNYSLGYTNCGIGGNTIAMIRNRLPKLLRNIEAEIQNDKAVYSVSDNKRSSIMVILFWDSGIGDIDESKLFDEEVELLRYVYAQNVRYVVNKILSTGAYMAISGPEVLRESSKGFMLDAYRDINIAIANSFDMEYIDMRTAFLNEINAGRNPTVDGEHPNENGTAIIAKLFVESIHKWKSKL